MDWRVGGGVWVGALPVWRMQRNAVASQRPGSGHLQKSVSNPGKAVFRPWGAHMGRGEGSGVEDGS